MTNLPPYIELACAGCDTRFRLKPKNGRFPTKPVKCPKCGVGIVVPDVEATLEAGTEPISHSSVFGRPQASKPTETSIPAVAKPAGRQFKDITRLDEELERPVAKPAPKTAAKPKAGRTFKTFEPDPSPLEKPDHASEPGLAHDSVADDVPEPTGPPAKGFEAPVTKFVHRSTKLDVDPLRPLESLPEMDFDEEAPIARLKLPEAAVTKEVEIPSDLLDEAEKLMAGLDLSSEVDFEAPPKLTPNRPKLAAAKKPRMPRAPENKERPFLPDNARRDTTAEVPRSVLKTIAEESSLVESSEPGQEIPPMTASDLEHGVRVRIEDIIYGPVRLEGLVKLLKSGVWMGVIELEIGNLWLPMRQHPIFGLVEDDLHQEAHGAIKNMMAHRPEPPETVPGPIVLADNPGGIAPATRPVPIPNATLLREMQVARSATPQEPTPAPAVETAPAVSEPDIAPKNPPPSIPAPGLEPPEAAPEAQEATVTAVPEVAQPSVPEVAQPSEFLPPAKGGSLGLFKGVLGVTALVATVGLVAVATDVIPTKPTTKPVIPPPRAAIESGLLVMNQASNVAMTYAALRKKTVEDLEKSVSAALDKANYGDALETTAELRRRQPESLRFVRLRHRALMGAREYGDARLELIDAAATVGTAEELKDLYVESVTQDPTLRDTVVTLVDDVKVDAVKRLGGGRSISFKIKRDGANVFAFKPAQEEWEERWRSEVAAWRLCEIAACEFKIPRSRTGRISREDFEALYPLDSANQRGYSRRFEDLWWKSESGEYLYGVLKDWVPHFTDFPVEHTHIWENWLDATSDPSVLELPLKTAIRGLFVYKGGDYYRKILKERRGASTRQVARQLSNLLVFDFLTNNWDRFSALEDYYGVNNQFADGGFVSIDNGACFHEQSSARVDARFEPVERVSRRLITSLRMLDPDWVNPLLFPMASDEEKQRLEVFWNRRDQVLTRVDELVRRHGEEKVYVFQ